MSNSVTSDKLHNSTMKNLPLLSIAVFSGSSSVLATL